MRGNKLAKLCCGATLHKPNLPLPNIEKTVNNSFGGFNFKRIFINIPGLKVSKGATNNHSVVMLSVFAQYL